MNPTNEGPDKNPIDLPQGTSKYNSMLSGNNRASMKLPKLPHGIGKDNEGANRLMQNAVNMV